MSSIDEVKSIIADAGLQSMGAVVANPQAERSYLVPILMGPTKGGRRNPSGRLLAETKRKLHELGYSVEFILMDEARSQIEEALRQSLISSFPSLIRNSFLSEKTGVIHVWLDTKRLLNRESLSRLQTHVGEFARLFSLSALKINLLQEALTPTKTELLIRIRSLAPVGLTVLQEKLHSEKLEVPSHDWLNRRLDGLRKAGLVIRTKSEEYSLTLDALRLLGTTRGRRSQDIIRLLALARSSS